MRGKHLLPVYRQLCRQFQPVTPHLSRRFAAASPTLRRCAGAHLDVVFLGAEGGHRALERRDLRAAVVRLLLVAPRLPPAAAQRFLRLAQLRAGELEALREVAGARLGGGETAADVVELTLARPCRRHLQQIQS